MKNSAQSLGYGKLSELCDANIPMEMHPGIVALEKPKKEDRSEVESTCQEFADSVVLKANIAFLGSASPGAPAASGPAAPADKKCGERKNSFRECMTR